MSKNPIFPYAIIAILGIVFVIMISFLGVHQRDARENPDEGNDSVVLDAEGLYKKSCASCHGGDLTGGGGPDLTEVGDRLSEGEIEDIIINGTDDGMPEGLVNDSEAGEIAEWLFEYDN